MIAVVFSTGLPARVDERPANLTPEAVVGAAFACVAERDRHPPPVFSHVPACPHETAVVVFVVEARGAVLKALQRLAVGGVVALPDRIAILVVLRTTFV